MGAAAACGVRSHAENRPDAPAEFVVTTEVAAKNPERFGANLPNPELNQFVSDPSMEGQIIRITSKATGGGADFLVNDKGETTDFYECLKDGFFEGATIRVYRAEPYRLVRRDGVRRYGASAASGRRIELEKNDPAAAVRAGDVYFLDLRTDELDRSKVGGTQWDQQAAGLATLSRDSSTHAPENGGRSCLKVAALRAEGVRISSGGAYSDPDNGWYPTLAPGRKYRWEAWMKQSGLPTGEATLAMSADYGAVAHRSAPAGSVVDVTTYSGGWEVGKKNGGGRRHARRLPLQLAARLRRAELLLLRDRQLLDQPHHARPRLPAPPGLAGPAAAERHARGDMVNVETRSAPTRNVPATSEYYPRRSDLPLTASYAFRDGDRWSVFALSRKINGDTPVTLRLPFTSVGAATLYRLAGNPRDTNLDEMKVAIRENALEAAKINPAEYRFALPPGSIYLFVFEGTKGAAKP